MSKIIVISAILTLAVAAPGRTQTAAPSTSVAVKVPQALVDKATNPTPPANATQKKGIGKGHLAVNTANSSSDTDSFWAEQIDIDGDGTVDDSNLIWDDEDKVLYIYADDAFTCRNGGTGSGGMMIAIFGKGNTQHQPAGSGWYAVDLDESECGAKKAGIYGCKFDAKQQATACGIATLDEKNDEISVVTVSD
jgi:hypothetical protein